MSAVPRFSIVIPTRNRAALLAEALDSATSQTCADLEIVVADNASTDDTAEVVAAAGDGRIRYVRSDEMLPAHANWERAVGEARGEWVGLLPDDDAWVPSALERATAWAAEFPGLRAMGWLECAYHHDGGAAEHAGLANVVVVDPFPGGVEVIPGADELARLFARRERRVAPGFANALVRRDLIDDLRAMTGRVFGTPDPFISSGAAVMAIEPEFLGVMLPLTVRGVSPVSITQAFLHNARDGHEVVREFDADGLITEVPVKARLSANLIAESLARLARDLPELFSAFEMDPVAYYVSLRHEIDDARRRDDDGAAADAWSDALSAEPAAVRSAVRRTLRAQKRRRQARDLSRTVARGVPGLAAAGRRARASRPAHQRVRVLPGAEHGFSTITGAAAFVDADVMPVTPQTAVGVGS